MCGLKQVWEPGAYGLIEGAFEKEVVGVLNGCGAVWAADGLC